MTRYLSRLILSYILFGLLRSVERHFGFLGVLAAGGILLLTPVIALVCLRIAQLALIQP